jgi:predicted GH43/DUF377 family glycosyl hydrolase
MKKNLQCFLLLFMITACVNASESPVISTKRIVLDGYYDAFNPSIIKTDEGYLMVFRYCPNRANDAYTFIGVVKLNESFDPISTPQLLDSRFGNTDIPSHSEDARILTIGDSIYLVYNDNSEVINPTFKDHRRDIFVAELVEENGIYSLLPPSKMIYPTKYADQNWQKNWVPFDWNGLLLMGYSIQPHEVIFSEQFSGICTQAGVSKMIFDWDYGTLRGGTPALMVGDQYMAFFHSSKNIVSDVSNGESLRHYFIGAYKFSPEPPFNITKISPEPINDDTFYTDTNFHRRVVFPGGFVVSGDYIYLVYGKNDEEIWVAQIDKNVLEASLITVKSK